MQDFEIRNELVLVFRVHLDSYHWNIPWKSGLLACQYDRGRGAVERVRDCERTVDGVDDLAVGGAGAALLDLCVVELQEVVDPSQQICARDGGHGCGRR